MSSRQILFVKAVASVTSGDVSWCIRLKPRPQGGEIAAFFWPGCLSQRLWLRFTPSPATSSDQLLGGGAQAGRGWQEARGRRLCGMWGD